MLTFQPLNLNDRILVIHQTGACLGDLTKMADGCYVFFTSEPTGGSWPWTDSILYEIANKIGELNREPALKGLAAQAQELKMGYE